MLAAFIVRTVIWLSDRAIVPRMFHGFATGAALRLIIVYKKFISPRSKRQCLFEPSCSSRSADAFEQFGWSRGLKLTARQLKRCGGEFSIITSASGDIVLITNDGERFAEAELASVLKKMQS